MAVVNIEVVGVGFVPLNQIDPRGVASGKPVSDTAGGFWSLAKSSATVDHTAVEAVLNDPTLRWLIETNPATAISSLTGPVTGAGPGAAATTVVVPITVVPVAAPSTPASGHGAIYVDSTSKNLAVKDDAGVVKHGVQTMATAARLLTSISDAGAVGSVATGIQSQTLVGDVTDVTFSGLDMNAVLGYRLLCQFAANTAGFVSLRPNADASNGETDKNATTYNTITPTNFPDYAAYLYMTQAGDQAMIVDVTIFGSTGAVKGYHGVSFYKNGSTSYGFALVGRYTPTANVTSLVIHTDSASGIKAGSIFTLIPILAV